METIFTDPRLLQALHGVIQAMEDPVPIIGVQPAGPGLDARLGAGIVSELLGSIRRPPKFMGSQVPVPEHVVARQGHEPKPFFALPQRFVCPLFIGDVVGDPQQRLHRTRLVTERTSMGFQPSTGAFHPHHSEFEPAGLALKHSLG